MSWLVVSPGEARPAIKYAPLGPLTVFQQWRSSDPDTRFLDLDGTEEVTVDDLPITGMKGVAIACMGGDLLRRAERVTALVREAAPEITVVWGGAFPTSFAEVVAAEVDVDALIVGPAPPSPPNLGPRDPSRRGSARILSFGGITVGHTPGSGRTAHHHEPRVPLPLHVLSQYPVGASLPVRWSPA